MRIEHIEIENYRSIRAAEVSLDAMTTFIGRNSVGKSTLLYALESFYNVGAQYSHLDYYNHQQAEAEIRIRITYGALRPDEHAEFGGYVHNGKLVVTKVVNSGGARYYGAAAQIPQFAELRKLGTRERRAALKAAIESGDFADFGELPTRGEDVDRAMDAYEAAHPDQTRPVERETQFLGPKNVGGGKLDKFTKFVLVPAVRDAASELEKRGAIMQLLDMIVSRSIASRQDFQQFKESFEAQARQLYDKANLPELTELGRLVTERLKRYAPGAELIIDFDELTPPTIPLPDALVTVAEDQFKVPVKYSGHGLQRALILALLEQLSLTLPAAARQASAEGEQATGDQAAQPSRPPDLILAIEEPELYLHPARSRYLAKILHDLGQPTQPEAGSSVQVLCVTHSPYFVDVAHFDEVRMCRKVSPVNQGEPGMTKFRAYTRLEASQRLAQLTGKPPESFTAQSFVTHAAPVLNSIVNEGLFADVAVVVEGESDVAALWAMQSHLEHKWEELGVVVVPAGGKSKIDRVVVAFEGFEIPTYFMFDADRKKNQSAPVNRLLLRLGGRVEEDYPSTAVDVRSAVFQDDIETYLESVAGDRFAHLRETCAARCGHERLATALKNSEVMTEFLKDAKAEGIVFDVLESIVSAITALSDRGRPQVQLAHEAAM